MKRLIAATAFVCAFALTTLAADARPRHVRHHTTVAVHCVPDNNGRQVCSGQVAQIQRRATGYSDANGNSVSRREASAASSRGYCHRETAAGSIVIACGLADKMSGFISDVVARGFKGRVHCFALGGHVRNSLHYRAEACDFAQRGWGKTVRPMYHVRDLAAKWGLRDGCSFGDCGHIDSGRGLARLSWPARLAQMKAASR